MNQNYKAKEAYQNDKTAIEYDGKRFANLKGKITNILEMNAVIKALVPVKAGSKVLDVPCGTGRVTEWLLKKGFTVDGFDISEEMIEQAKKKLEKYSNLNGFHTGDASKMEFEDDTFDCVVCVRLLGHTPPDVRLKILSEFKRVSKEWIVLTYYYKNSLQRVLRSLKSVITKKPRMWFPVTKKEMEKELKKVGLEIVAYYPILPYISETWILLVRYKK